MAETRRKFDHDFREGAVRLVRETGKPIVQIARDLGINAGTLGNWVNADQRRRGGDGALSEDERAELARPRKENAELAMECDVLNARWPSDHQDVGVTRTPVPGGDQPGHHAADLGSGHRGRVIGRAQPDRVQRQGPRRAPRLQRGDQRVRPARDHLCGPPAPRRRGSSTSGCVNAVNQAEAQARSQLPGALSTLFNDISARAPNAQVVVIGYPEFYDLSRSSGCIGLSTTDRSALDGGADVLDSVIQAATAGHSGFAYAEVRPAFAGHEICDSSSWLHSVDWFNLGDSYHPTASGQSGGYYPVFSAAA